MQKTNMAIDITLRGWKHDMLSCTERSQVNQPRLCMEAGEVKFNGLPIILYFPARATIYRRNTFFCLCASRYGFYLICDDLIGYIFIMQISISDNEPISLNTSAGRDG